MTTSPTRSFPTHPAIEASISAGAPRRPRFRPVQNYLLVRRQFADWPISGLKELMVITTDCRIVQIRLS